MFINIKKIMSDVLRNILKTGYIKSVFMVLFDRNKFKYDGIHLEIPITLCPPSMRSCFIKRQYEVGESMLVSTHLDAEDIVLELGACVGYISILASKILSHKKHVVLEINKDLLSVIENNKNNNKALFTALHGTISKKQVFFKVSRKMTTGKLSSSGEIIIPTYKISQLEKMIDSNFDTLICDIEGAEYTLIRTQDFSLIKKVFIEWHDVDDFDNRDTGRRLLLDNGFELIQSIDMNDFFIRK